MEEKHLLSVLTFFYYCEKNHGSMSRRPNLRIIGWNYYVISFVSTLFRCSVTVFVYFVLKCLEDCLQGFVCLLSSEVIDARADFTLVPHHYVVL